MISKTCLSTGYSSLSIILFCSYWCLSPGSYHWLFDHYLKCLSWFFPDSFLHALECNKALQSRYWIISRVLIKTLLKLTISLTIKFKCVSISIKYHVCSDSSPFLKKKKKSLTSTLDISPLELYPPAMLKYLKLLNGPFSAFPLGLYYVFLSAWNKLSLFVQLTPTHPFS